MNINQKKSKISTIALILILSLSTIFFGLPAVSAAKTTLGFSWRLVVFIQSHRRKSACAHFRLSSEV